MLQLARSQSEDESLFDVRGQRRVVVQHELGVASASTSLGVQVETAAAVKYAALENNAVVGLENVPVLGCHARALAAVTARAP